MAWNDVNRPKYVTGAVGEWLFEIFARENSVLKNVDGWPDYVSVPDFIKTGKDPYSDDPAVSAHPVFDHGRIFLREDGSAVLIYHPYADGFDSEEYRSWAERNGLAVQIFPQEYDWYGEDTLLILVAEKGCKLKVAARRSDFKG
ncbi:MAG: hypothetical protein LKJ94_05770 [Candidatus Methanomethylophilus sp.]|jgi:hypothetical protein|nr:hypothetical protein [Methanomethylophilus sp.]MCI2092530.1 hypothetical protein [Methanomethylophilus sp.]